jgi:hypothetical protein
VVGLLDEDEDDMDVNDVGEYREVDEDGPTDNRVQQVTRPTAGPTCSFRCFDLAASNLVPSLVWEEDEEEPSAELPFAKAHCALH